MAENKKTQTTENNVAEIPEQLISKSDDSDMPKPQTDDYKPMFKLTQTFMSLFTQALGNMPYSTIITNNQGEKIKLIDLVRFIEAKRDNINLDELNTVIGFIAGAQFKYVRPLMELVENAESQKTLWAELPR